MDGIAESIKKLVMCGRGDDLLKIMMGMSDFNLPTDLKEPMTHEGQAKWQMALLHLQFVNKYGVEVESVDDGGRLYFSYPSEFDEWLGAGHPGIDAREIKAYLIAHPLSF